MNQYSEVTGRKSKMLMIIFSGHFLPDQKKTKTKLYEKNTPIVRRNYELK